MPSARARTEAAAHGARCWADLRGRNTKGYSSTYLAMGFANVRAGTRSLPTHPSHARTALPFWVVPQAGALLRCGTVQFSMFTSCDSRAVHRCCVRRRATRASSLRCLHCQRQNLTRARTPCDRVRACTPGSWPRVGDHALPAPRRQVFGPRACAKRSEMKHDRCVLHCEISTASFSAGERRRQLRGDRRVLRLFPPHAPSSHAQGSSGVVATVPFAWRGHTKSTTARSGPSPDLAVRLE